MYAQSGRKLPPTPPPISRLSWFTSAEVPDSNGIDSHDCCSLPIPAAPLNTTVTPPATRGSSPHKQARNQSSSILGHAKQTYLDWERVQKLKNGSDVVINGHSLELADIVVVAKNGAGASLAEDPAIKTRIERSIETLYKHLRKGHLVYGVTTGFGGSADARTNDTTSLQRALIQMQTTGILTSKDIGKQQKSTVTKDLAHEGDYDAAFDSQSMPTTWVRASMLTRCNSIIRGHSAVRDTVAETILALLKCEITPVVPLRGSISASGDLSPLSYIAGAIEGNPDVFCRIGKTTDNIITADKALKLFNIEPVVLQAKEGLGLLNGTAFSAATASLAIYQSQQFAILSQALTAMAVEALAGTAESFFPKIAEMRPHPGQNEAAANIFAFLGNSFLASCVGGPKITKIIGLYQDRYALRTSSQWIGPQLEDLCHAHEQLLVEINSTTDNPLVDAENDHILHGGNFQAAVVASTMDRARLALDKFGRMLFAQATEMINPLTNKGLPANLSSDDPSLSYTCKGIDINMASYASELAFLANPVGSHVMSAEMHNQSINSVALISSRYTFQALDTLRILCAAYLFTVCQALDLRVQQYRFNDEFKPILLEHLESTIPELAGNISFKDKLWAKFQSTWPETMTLDLIDRGTKSMESLVPVIIANLPRGTDVSAVTTFTTEGAFLLVDTYKAVQTHIDENRKFLVPAYLGRASRALYEYIRSPDGLGVGFHKGLVEHPTQPNTEGLTAAEAANRKTIGSSISTIYEALRDGRIDDIVMGVLRDTGRV